MSKHEEYLDAESSDDDEGFHRSSELLNLPIKHTQALAARSIKVLKRIASKSKKSLHSMIQWKLPQQDVLDRGIMMSPVAAGDVEEEDLLMSTTTRGRRGEGNCWCLLRKTSKRPTSWCLVTPHHFY